MCRYPSNRGRPYKLYCYEEPFPEYYVGSNQNKRSNRNNQFMCECCLNQHNVDKHRSKKKGPKKKICVFFTSLCYNPKKRNFSQNTRRNRPVQNSSSVSSISDTEYPKCPWRRTNILNYDFDDDDFNDCCCCCTCKQDMIPKWAQTQFNSSSAAHGTQTEYKRRVRRCCKCCRGRCGGKITTNVERPTKLETLYNPQELLLQYNSKPLFMDPTCIKETCYGQNPVLNSRLMNLLNKYSLEQLEKVSNVLEQQEREFKSQLIKSSKVARDILNQYQYSACQDKGCIVHEDSLKSPMNSPREPNEEDTTQSKDNSIAPNKTEKTQCFC